MHALKALHADTQVAVLEAALHDPESSVHIAAADALGEVHGPGTPARILQAVSEHGRFQMKAACVDALGQIGEAALPALLDSLDSAAQPVREVAVRALYKLGRNGLADRVVAPLRARILDPAEDEVVRYWAIDALLGLRLKLAAGESDLFTQVLLRTLPDCPSTTVQLHAAEALGHLATIMPESRRREAQEKLERLFRNYGDASDRTDAAFGWRLVGNALLRFGASGRARLEALRTQEDDRWLAWIAYQVVHVPIRSGKFELCDEAEAVKVPDTYAPAFPGYRSW